MSKDSYITLNRHRKQQIAPGRYKLELQQRIEGVSRQGAKFTDHDKRLFSLVVRGERFKLNTTDIRSVHPPADSLGEYSLHCSHLVMTKSALPWERHPGEGASETAPWLALLVVHEGELRPLPEPRSMTLEQLAQSRPEKTFFPGFTIDPNSEKLDDPCQVVELPRSLFLSIAPRVTELELLAHVRQVEPDAKVLRERGQSFAQLAGATQDEPAEADEYAVVIGNRLGTAAAAGTLKQNEALKEGHRHRAYLVGLEGYAPFLPGGRCSGELEDFDRVRLVCLYHWEFAVVERPHSFETVLEALDIDPSHLQLPTPAAEPEASDPVARRMRTALDMGYVALDHSTRVDDRTVSWYRGPLQPYQSNENPGVRSVRAADAALRYDPTTGLFDVSYAAAWQLGRSVALRNMSFATQVVSERNNVIHQCLAQQEWRRMVASKTLPAEVTILYDAHTPTLGALAQLADALANGLYAFVSAFEDPPPATLVAPRMLENDSEQFEQGLAELADPEAIRDLHDEYRCRCGLLTAGLAAGDEGESPLPAWLARLALLYGLPFHYLVPDPRMLPAESLRMFHVDADWLFYLEDGALSIGRDDDLQAAHDTALLVPMTMRKAHDDARLVRARRLGLESPGDAELYGASGWTGFLLRSTAVREWPGAEIEAWNPAGTRLHPLRLDQLAPTVILALFEGDVARLRFSKPAESLFFGLSRKRSEDLHDTDLEKTLRKLDGTPYQGKSIPAQFHAGAKRVLDLSAMAEAMRRELSSIRGDKPMSSADFSLQMIQAVEQVEFWKTTTEEIQ